MADDSPSSRNVKIQFSRQRPVEDDISDELSRHYRFLDRIPVAAAHVRGDALYLNRQAEGLVGYPRSTMSTLQDWFKTLYPDRAPSMIAKYRLDRDAPRFDHGGDYLRADGAQRVLEVRGAPDDLGDIWLIYDITEQTTLKCELQTARREADASNRAKSEFIANMSHEIRTPLNGVLAMAQLMSRGGLRADQRKKLDVIQASGENLLHVINDILDFSKINAGQLDLECIEFDPERILEGTLSGFAPLAQHKQIALYLDIAPNARGLRLGDPGRLRQIVDNFVSNALRFTTEGSVRIRIMGNGDDGRQGLTIAVTDTGLGIAPDKLPLLFQKFSQVDASITRKFGGAGLGLAICHELATLMRGRVWAESEPGVGSTFWAELALPCVGPIAAVAEDVAFHDFDDGFGDANDGDDDLAAIRILAAEDNPTNQLVLTTIMKAFGVDLTLVGNGREAVDAWANAEFDLVLMDVQMPEMDGVTATRLIRDGETQTGRRRTPILALTANAFSHQVSAYKAAGMDAHVAKPIDMNQLQSEIARVMIAAQAANASIQHVA